MFRLLLVTAIVAISNLVAADVSGKWTGITETNGSRVRIYVTLNQHNQEISGTVATGDEARPVPIEKAEMLGDQVMFEVHDNANRIVKFRLSLTGAVLGGEAAAGDQVSRVSMSTPTKGEAMVGPIGSGSGDRVPSGVGSGVGSGEGVGGGVYRVGGGVSAPVLIYKVEPDYTEEARAAKSQGTVLLYVEIDPNGTATNIKVQRSLGLGLDEKAIEAVRKWKFMPGRKGDQPVTVQATIEVNFRL
jgi:TonB family protein